MIKHDPNKITATLKVVVTGEFYDDEASEETLRYCVEQDLEDAGFEVDVSMLKEQEAVKPYMDYDGQDVWRCGKCGNSLMHPSYYESDEDAKNYIRYCSHCSQKVKWDE